MAVLTVTPIPITKVEMLAGTAANSGGDSFPNTGKEFLVIKNLSGGASITLTGVASGPACSFGVAASAHNKTFTIPADSKTYAVGPFPTLEFNDANGRMQFTYSDVTGVTVAAYSLPPAS